MAYLEVYLRVISRRRPWHQGRYFPLVPIRVSPDTQFNERRVRRAVAVCRAFGGPVGFSYRRLFCEYSKASRSCRALWQFVRVRMWVLALSLVSISVYALLRGDGGSKITSERINLYGLGYGCGLFACLAVWRVLQAGKKWRRQNSDAEALRTCLRVLYLCGELHVGRVKALRVDREIADLCREIGDFVTSSDMFPDPGRRSAVLHHTSAVQTVLMDTSQTLLNSGKSGIPDLVEVIRTVLENLMDERWLNLLDASAVTTQESVTQSPDGVLRRRDVWIVIGGSAAAAIGLGAAASLGVPLVAAVPAALIFLLGPATLWGSSRLGMSPRQLLESVRTPIVEQGGAQQPPAATGSGTTTTAGTV